MFVIKLNITYHSVGHVNSQGDGSGTTSELSLSLIGITDVRFTVWVKTRSLGYDFMVL